MEKKEKAAVRKEIAAMNSNVFQNYQAEIIAATGPNSAMALRLEDLVGSSPSP